LARNGTMPQEAYTEDKVRVLSTKAPPDLIRKVRELAVVRDCTASVIVKKAVEQYLRENY
jgi:predicted transcriptional regulator